MSLCNDTIVNMKYNIYCDESCHLLYDDSDYMVLGCTWCLNEDVYSIHKRIRDIKRQNGINPNSEIKWSKISSNNLIMYQQIVDYFFDTDNINFRAIVINKKELNHQEYGQSHDEWYYKMLYLLTHHIMESSNSYRIFLDYKDTQSGFRSRKLHEILCNSEYDFDKRIISNVQCLPSHEIGLIQLCDVLIGALAYYKRGLTTSTAKLSLIDQIKKRSGKSLEKNTLPQEKKFNLFFWHGDKKE